MDHHDRAVRQGTFEFLQRLSDQYGEVLRRDELQAGFLFDGVRVPLLSPTGIFKPRILNLPLTITTAPNAPYPDRFRDGLLYYRYRGTRQDIHHRDNTGMKNARTAGVPLIYLHGLVPGKYVAAWPVYVVDCNDQTLIFTIEVDKEVTYPENRVEDVRNDIEREIRRRYATVETTIRLHQRTFRERVVSAYNQQCAMCRLRHQELLDAAHIVPDAEDAGEPIVNNGIALCKIHHAAFDQGILGIRPDYVVQIRQDVLNETDGPMLKYGLQEMHEVQLTVPTNRNALPDPKRLQVRYERFLAYPAAP